MSQRRILITAALPYINNVPHMGHVVGSHLPADIFKRCATAKGYDAMLVGGSDEHGTPSVVAAKDLGIPVTKLVDGLHSIHKEIYEKLSISYDNYSRTSTSEHHEEVAAFFKELEKRHYIKEGTASMFYCEKDGMFLPDRFITATCPKCGYEGANADQCEQCSAVFSSTELKDPKCKICGSEPSIRDSKHLYLDMKKIEPQLSAWIESQKDVWRTHVYGEAKRWISEGLRERSITRDLSWGIKVPLNGYENKVFYVWFDAPIAYMTFTKQMGGNAFEKFWKNPGGEIFHFLGKDNIPFHTVFWPAMLLAHGNSNLPSNVVGYNYLLYGDQKFSKSKGIGVFCYNLLHSDIDVDSLRAYLTTIIPETRDASFSWNDYQKIVNGDLIGKFGNFFNRTLSLTHKYFGGKLDHTPGLHSVNEETSKVLDAMNVYPERIGDLIMKTEIRRAFITLMEYAAVGNVFIDRTAPWKYVNSDPARAKESLYIALNLARSLAIVGAPFVPNSMQKVWKEQLNLDGSPGEPGMWHTAPDVKLGREHRISVPHPLYGRIDATRLEHFKTEFSQQPSLKDIIESKAILDGEK